MSSYWSRSSCFLLCYFLFCSLCPLEGMQWIGYLKSQSFWQFWSAHCQHTFTLIHTFILTFEAENQFIVSNTFVYILMLLCYFQNIIRYIPKEFPRKHTSSLNLNLKKTKSNVLGKQHSQWIGYSSFLWV